VSGQVLDALPLRTTMLEAAAMCVLSPSVAAVVASPSVTAAFSGILGVNVYTSAQGKTFKWIVVVVDIAAVMVMMIVVGSGSRSSATTMVRSDKG